MSSNIFEHFYLSKDLLRIIWHQLINLIAERKKFDEVTYFLRSTCKKERLIYEKNGVMDGTCVYFPRKCILVRNQDLKGIWMIACLSSLGKPDILPYGNQCIALPAKDVIFYLGEKSEKAEDIESNSEEETDDTEKTCVYKSAPTLMTSKSLFHGKEKSSHGKKVKPRKTRSLSWYGMKKTDWKREEFLKDSPKEIKAKIKTEVDKKTKNSDGNIKFPSMPGKNDVPLLFFEIAYTFNSRNQYVRMLLISKEHRQVDWCRENLLEVPLGSNPILQLRNGKVTTSKHFHPKLIVEVFIVGDIDLKGIQSSPIWFRTKKGTFSSRDPIIGVHQQ